MNEILKGFNFEKCPDILWSVWIYSLICIWISDYTNEITFPFNTVAVITIVLALINGISCFCLFDYVLMYYNTWFIWFTDVLNEFDLNSITSRRTALILKAVGARTTVMPSKDTHTRPARYRAGWLHRGLWRHNASLRIDMLSESVATVTVTVSGCTFSW